MKSSIKALAALALSISLSPSLGFADDEMSTQTKPSTPVAPTPAGPGPAPGTATDAAKPTPSKTNRKLDPSLRAKIRKKAPFWIEDGKHGAAIRINKDGTFSSESQGGGSTAGTWKAFRGELGISWSDGGDSYTYPITEKKGALIVDGQALKKGRYVIP